MANPEIHRIVTAGGEDAQKRSHLPAIVLLLGAALLAHGLLLFNEGVFWDGALLRDYQVNHSWRAMHDLYFEYGTPQLYPFQLLISYLPQTVLFYKAAIWVSIALWGVLTYAIGCETGLVSRRESVFLGLVSVLYPAFQTAPEISMLGYTLCYALFLGGVLLALRAERAGKGHGRGLWAGSGALFILSFTIYSLLVFYGGFLILWVICRQRRQGGTWQDAARALVQERVPLLALPVLYWAIMRVWCPPHGVIYASYNAFSFQPRRMAGVTYHFLVEAVGKQLLTSLRLALTNPLAWLLAIAAAWSLRRLQRSGLSQGHQEHQEYQEHGDARACLLFGAALFFLGMFPYLVVGKAPTEHGWYSRNSLLIILPMAILLLGIARLLERTSGVRFRVGVGLFVFLLCGFALAYQTSYISWQARWVKTQAVIVHLRETPALRDYSTYFITDDFAVTPDDHRIFYDWAWLFKQAWGGETRVGLDSEVYYSDMFFAPAMRMFYTDRFLLGQFNPNGPRATLTIRRVGDRSDSDLCFHYLYYRLFHQDQLTDYLRRVVSVEGKAVR